jgi:hypothetical protein
MEAFVAAHAPSSTFSPAPACWPGLYRILARTRRKRLHMALPGIGRAGRTADRRG